MMQPRIPESESTVLRISNSGGVCRGGEGKCSVKKRRNKAAKKNFQILVTCKIWKFFFAAATILVTLISSWVGGRFDRLGDQS